MKRIMTRVLGLLLLSTLGSSVSARDGSIGFTECLPGFVEAGPNLCVQPVATGEKGKMYPRTDRRATENKTYVEAQAVCRAMNAHVCTLDEMWQAWEVIKSDVANHEMIGNIIADDHNLCINNSRDRENIEGICNRAFRLRYRCCSNGLPF